VVSEAKNGHQPTDKGRRDQTSNGDSRHAGSQARVKGKEEWGTCLENQEGQIIPKAIRGPGSRFRGVEEESYVECILTGENLDLLDYNRDVNVSGCASRDKYFKK